MYTPLVGQDGLRLVNPTVGKDRLDITKHLNTFSKCQDFLLGLVVIYEKV